MAGPLWYQADNTTWWWWSYVADLGPYTGPIPPPRPIWLPNEAGEIDYVVGRPHPSGDPRLFRDGTYDAGYYKGSYAYADSPGVIGGGGTYGPGSVVEPQDHLFIQFYPVGYPDHGTLPPPKPGLAYVPSTVIAGGYGPTIGEGHWSAWQPRFDVELSAPVDVWPVYGRGTVQSYLSTTDGGTEFDDAQTIFNDWRDALQAADNSGSGVENGRSVTLPNPPFTEGPRDADQFSALNYAAPDLPDFGGTVGFGFGGNRASWIFAEAGPFAFGGEHTYGYGFELGWGYIGQNVNGSANDTSLQTPPALSGLAVGVDYAAVPDDQIGPHTQGYVDFESGTATFRGWINEIYDADVEMHCDIIDGGDVPNTIPLTIWWKDTDTSQLDLSTTGSAFNRPWLDYEDGTVLEHVELPATPGTTFDHYYHETTTNLTIDLSGVSAEDFSLVIQPRWADPTVDLPGPFAPGGASYWSTQHIDGTDRCSANYLDVKALRPLGGNPYGTWRQPRWRYWVPGGLEFHCPGGGRPRVTVTEGHWSGWQPAFNQTHPALYQDDAGNPTSSPRFLSLVSQQFGTAHPSWSDAFDAVTAFLDDLRNPSIAFQGAGDWLTSFDVESNAPGPFTFFTPRAQIGQHLTTFIAPTPSLPVPPTSAAEWQYDGSAFTPLGWEDWRFVSYQGAEFGIWETYNAAGVQGPTTESTGYADWTDFVSFRAVSPGTLDFQSAAAAHDPDTASWSSEAWPSPAIGTELARFSQTSAAGPGTPVTPATLNPAVDFAIPVSSLGTTESWTLVVQPRFMVDGTAPPPHVPTILPGDTTFAFWEATSSGHGTSLMFLSANPPTFALRTPRWRYWIPSNTTVDCPSASALRLTQRNDGGGIGGHPRLNRDAGASSSQQTAAAPRLHRNNTYS